MPIKKSELYSSLWQSCDELRGGMDASQYKDYVLVLLFIKYVSDKYAGVPYAPITIPPGASFADMVALKGKPDLGDLINKKIVGPLAQANKLADLPDFNDSAKLGDGKEKVDRLTNLIAIFENKALDFSKNRADGDDILGDAYEYLMRHFATESGKSKGQFYTPAEVSRILAAILGIRAARTSSATTVYDPTCGSGSLLLKIADEARTKVTLYGQEKDAATSGLARMNMILHNNPEALVVQGNTLADPKFTDGPGLKTFDYVVANPPFSDKRWSTGIDPLNDPYDRFKSFGTPPAKQGDYAYLLHIVRSLKSTGQGACILPHGVLFRGNAEADIRRALVRKGYVKGIIGLPANLFYGTGIPACIVVLDKADAHTRKGIFMIDASAGFLKDGPKNRLRAMDLHQIVDVFGKRLELPGYSRLVGFAEIEKNDFNLNLPRYIDSQQSEDVQDIDGHLRGGIPERDIAALGKYWAVCPTLRGALFKPGRPGYVDLVVEKSAIKPTIYGHPEFVAFIARMNAHFAAWRTKTAKTLKALKPGCHPKEIIATLSEDLLAHYEGQPLIDGYDVYQHLMDYWAETMQDDAYLIAADGWKAATSRVIEKDKKGKERDKGWTCDLVPKPLTVARYFAKEQAAITALETENETVTARLAELEEEHSGEDGAFSDLDKINRATVTAALKEGRARPLGAPSESVAEPPADSNGHPVGSPLADAPTSETEILLTWLNLSTREADLKKSLRDAEAALDAQAYAKYPALTEGEIKTLVVDDKWLAALDAAIHGEMDRISQALTQRVKELAERYETPLPQMTARVAELETKVNRHLATMGFSWK
ncbi:MAG: N-6 DNA methylase [Opitutaceae bacterium]